MQAGTVSAAVSSEHAYSKHTESTESTHTRDLAPYPVTSGPEQGGPLDTKSTDRGVCPYCGRELAQDWLMVEKRTEAGESRVTRVPCLVCHVCDNWAPQGG